jgi:hypothetical protein
MVPEGTFKRRYSRDISGTRRLKLKNGTEVTAVQLNRDAVYDNLPEGFFHQETEHAGDAGTGSHSSKKLKEEEKAARSFFLPFENEIHTQRINLELEERQILTRFSENLSDDFSPEFWNLDPSVEQKYLPAMLRFLPVSHKIAGHARLTAECMAYILREKVSAIQENRPVVVSSDKAGGPQSRLPGLGKGRLGVDLVCGSHFTEVISCLHFDIGPLRKAETADYLPGGTIERFLHCFFGYFVPAETQVSFRVLAAPENRDFTLDRSGNRAILGYVTVL